MPGFEARTLAVLSVMAMLCCAPGVFAAECAEDANIGVCLDDETFQWCEGGEIKTAKCPDGQICVTVNPWYDGAGCVAPDDTACGDIPPQGECTSGNSVAWCDEGVPRVQPCDDDSECGWDETNGWYDCLPISNSTMAPGPDTAFDEMADTSEGPDDWSDPDTSSPRGSTDVGPEPDANTSSSPPDQETSPDESAPRNDVPTPTVTAGGGDVSDEPTTPPGDGGCAGSTPAEGWLLWALLLLGLSRRRRERSVTTA